MANTLKLGAGKWATGTDTVLAFNDENNNFKPLPFDFSRASSATVVNKAGLIETVGSGEPRIDFSNDAKGALLLEPSRMNLITQSESFDNAYWTKTNSSVVSGFVSPNGTTNAFKLVEDTSMGIHILQPTTPITTVIGTSYSLSAFYKIGERPYGIIGLHYNSSNGCIAEYEFSTDTFVYLGAAGANYSISNLKSIVLANGFVKLSCTITTGHTVAFPSFGVHKNLLTTGIIANNTYQGDGTSGVYIYGGQLEQASYATSYIPTSGSAVTRVADASSQTPPSGIIGQTEGGVIYMDFIAQNTGTTSQSHFWLGSSGSEIGLYGGNQLIFYSSGGVSISGGNIVTGQRYKVAFAYETNDYAAYVNGVQVGVDTSATYPTMSSIFLNSYFNGTEIQKKEIKDFKLYNTRLSNAELQALTT